MAGVERGVTSGVDWCRLVWCSGFVDSPGVDSLMSPTFCSPAQSR